HDEHPLREDAPRVPRGTKLLPDRARVKEGSGQRGAAGGVLHRGRVGDAAAGGGPAGSEQDAGEYAVAPGAESRAGGDVGGAGAMSTAERRRRVEQAELQGVSARQAGPPAPANPYRDRERQAEADAWARRGARAAAHGGR